MRGLTVVPGVANSARIEDIAEPPQSDGAVLVRTTALGVCGTDREIVAGAYGWAPPGKTRNDLGLLSEQYDARAKRWSAISHRPFPTSRWSTAPII